jgi:hypothetical protein
MFIGHFTIAFLMGYLVPGVPIIIPLIGVAFPDLLWPVLVLMGVEKVKFNKISPLQKDIIFESYPLSHSLVLTTLIAFVIGLIMALLLKNLLVAPVFAVASASHWVLDTIVHNKDLPVLGFSSKDVKVGFGLWKRGPLAFAIEYIFYAVVAIIIVPIGSILSILILGAIFHLININSYFGLTKENPFSPKIYSIIVLIAFALFIFFAQLILS